MTLSVRTVETGSCEIIHLILKLFHHHASFLLHSVNHSCFVHSFHSVQTGVCVLLIAVIALWNINVILNKTPLSSKRNTFSETQFLF